MDKRDLRQLEKMRKQIESYIDGFISLESLIGELIFLRDALSDIEKDWEYEFTEKIIDLETVSCYRLEKNFGIFHSDNIKIVNNSLIKIFNLIRQKEENNVKK